MTPLQQKLDGFVHGTNDWPFESSQQKFSKEVAEEVAGYINNIAKNFIEAMLVYTFIQHNQNLLRMVHPYINTTVINIAFGKKFPSCKFQGIYYNNIELTFKNMFTPDDVGQLFVRESSEGNKILTLLEIIDLKKEGYREIAPYGKYGVFLHEGNNKITYSCEEVCRFTNSHHEKKLNNKGKI